MQRGDFEAIYRAMGGLPVTIRLLDPPLHEFLPHEDDEIKELADEMGVTFEKLKGKVESLHEFNPMLGHRGCRLGNTYPEITEMQARAIIEAAMNVKAQGIPVHVEIMVPLVGNHKELRYQKGIIDATAEQVFSERNDKIDYMVGTMIEVPRAAVTANQIAEVAEFFSFGTNDLTQYTTAVDRQNANLEGFYYPHHKGLLRLIKMAADNAHKNGIWIGICGELGADMEMTEAFLAMGIDELSVSPACVLPLRKKIRETSVKERQEEILKNVL